MAFEHSECVAALASTENAVAMLPQPFATTALTKNENIRIALDMTKEWEKLAQDNGSPTTLITGVAVADGFCTAESRGCEKNSWRSTAVPSPM